MLVVLIARKLGPTGNGQYAMAILLPTLMVNLLNFGVGPATVYHVGRGTFSARHAFWGNLRLGVVIAIIGVAIVIPVLVALGSTLFPGVPQTLLLIGLVTFPATLLRGYLQSILQGVEDFWPFNLLIVLPPYIALVGAAVGLYGFNAGLTSAVGAYMLGEIIAVMLSAHLVLKRAAIRDHGYDPWDSREYQRTTIRYGVQAHLSNVLTFINYRADIYLVNLFLNPAATGVYVVAVQIAERLWMISQATSTVLFPKLSAMESSPIQRLALTRTSQRAVLILTAGVGVLVAIPLYWFLGIVFGVEYVDALPIYLSLLPGIIAGAGARVQAHCIAAAGKPNWNMYVACGVVSANVMLNSILVPVYGVLGAAFATSVVYLGDAGSKGLIIRKMLTRQA